MNRDFHYGRLSIIVLCLCTLSACATFSEDGGFGPVASEIRESLGQDANWVRNSSDRALSDARVARLLESELTAESAMQVALLNNPTLQAEYANLGLQEAELVQAGRLPNPGFTFGKTTGGGAQEIERGLHFNVLALLTLPVRLESKKNVSKHRSSRLSQQRLIRQWQHVVRFTKPWQRSSLRTMRSRLSQQPVQVAN